MNGGVKGAIKREGNAVPVGAAVAPLRKHRVGSV